MSTLASLARSVLLLLAVSSPAMAVDEFPEGGPVPADRVVLRFRQGTFRLLEVMPLTKVLPPSDTLADASGRSSGFWYELRSGNGGLLYRRVVGDPIRVVFEGPDLDTEGAAIPDRKEAIPDERVFSLLIPRAAEGDQLVLFSSPLRPGAQGEPAGEVARIDLMPIIIP